MANKHFAGTETGAMGNGNESPRYTADLLWYANKSSHILVGTTVESRISRLAVDFLFHLVLSAVSIIDQDSTKGGSWNT